jgi:hypothetical protein
MSILRGFIRNYVGIAVLVTVSAVATSARADVRPSAPRGVYSISEMIEEIPLHSGTYKRLPSCGPSAIKFLRSYQGLDLIYRGSIKLGGLVWLKQPCSDSTCSEEIKANHPDPPKGAWVWIDFSRIRDRARGSIAYYVLTEQSEVSCADSFSFRGKYRGR